jgi:type IX secretion system PorP/SprF family membrane protein
MKLFGFKVWLVSTIVLASTFAKAQDIHFSQFTSAPLLLNPAFTGVNGCDYRATAIYRNQWTGIAPFRTVAASYDMALAKKRTKGKGHYGGIGVSLFSDKAGDSQLSTNQVNLNLSYTIILNNKGTQSLTTGIYGGAGNRSIDLSKLTFDSQFGSGGYDGNLPTRENIARTNIWYADAGAGFLYNNNINKTTNFYLGTAAYHITQPNLSFLNDVNEELFIKLVLHGGAHFKVSKQFYLLPSVMYLNQGPHSQLNFGSLVKWSKDFTFRDNTSFYFGGWYRLKDAVIFTTRVDFAGINVGFSYDVNLSKLSKATRGNGGPELSIVYTGCLKGKKNNVRYCPVM